MRNALLRGNLRLCGWVVIPALSLPAAIHARTNDVMGEVRFSGRSGVEKTSGVWVDGQYVGYLKELKGSKKLLLLLGEHLLAVRQAGCQDFMQKVQIEPHEVMCALNRSRKWKFRSKCLNARLPVT